MKKFLFSIAILIIFLNAKAQECNCDIALNKDRIQITQTENQIKTFLSILSKENYEQYKSSGGFKLGIPIVDDMISLSADWSDFQLKRQAYFSQVDEKWSMNKSHEELRIITSPISYDAWINCIKTCNSDKIGIYGWVEDEAKNDLRIYLKYNPPPGATKSLQLVGELHNGTTILSNGKKTAKIVGVIAPNGTKTFTIIRNPKTGLANFHITAGGYKGFSYNSTFINLPPSRNAKATLVLDKPEIKLIEVGPKCVYLSTPELHEKGCNGCAVPFGDGQNEGANNTMYLKVDGDDRILKNVVAPVCEGAAPQVRGMVEKSRGRIKNLIQDLIKELDKSCAFVENMNYVVGQDGKTAVATFKSSSRSTYWRFCGTEYIVQKLPKPEEINLGEIKAQSFTFKVPSDCTGAILNLKIGNNDYAINVGESRPDVNINLKAKIPSQNSTTYEYRLD
ncbi:hypothetical protein [Rufibacter latericius]|uniref:Carboxypeptidase regulatory-like domain-containing protein n=1 Tax=Rufibacter latericius TaxID=2487040 RepID=A0A3M9MAK4_9BACT|nr:hypothetical protein [Rufibacter latericius]RNI22602.1 hypothetical protein EFB08_21135 [Rufibacter latericius]